MKLDVGYCSNSGTLEDIANVLDCSEGSSELDSRKNLMRDREFFLMLRQSVFDGMKNILGEDNSITALYSLMTSIERPHEFQRTLHSMFGSGSFAFEKVILEELYRKLNLPFKARKGYQFPDYVELAARLLLENRNPIDSRSDQLTKRAIPEQVKN